MVDKIHEVGKIGCLTYHLLQDKLRGIYTAILVRNTSISRFISYTNFWHFRLISSMIFPITIDDTKYDTLAYSFLLTLLCFRNNWQHWRKLKTSNQSEEIVWLEELFWNIPNSSVLIRRFTQSWNISSFYLKKV